MSTQTRVRVNPKAFLRPGCHSCRNPAYFRPWGPSQNTPLCISWRREAEVVQSVMMIRPNARRWQRASKSTSLVNLSAVQVKVKVWTLVIAPLTRVRLVTSSALQSWKWQLIGIGMSQWCRSTLCAHPLPVLTDSWTHDGAASRHTTAPISRSRPVPRSRSY